MPLFGHQSDINFFTHISREVMGRIIEQKIGYYKISLINTKSDIYGESDKKVYNDPVLINCLLESNEQTSSSSEKGIDITRDIVVNFLRMDLVELQLVPEIGDILLWNNDYFEVNNVEENQYFVGKNPDYAYAENVEQFGSSISIIVRAHYTRKEKLPFA